MKYRIILDEKHPGVCSGKVFISEEGAKIIWAAYDGLYNKYSSGQTMDQREARGGICWLSEIDYWKKQGALDKDFDYTAYILGEDEQSIKKTSQG